MATKIELREREKWLKQKIEDVPEKYKASWKRELKKINKQLYGHF